ncbi:DivIVA domain-containing protein [Mycoplasmopsis gallopavonis]|uniref:DivIVA domain-containing protein n=1 Tax=Mycoplasmopsis gallopavonis TaxID=76629 RepID=A0A449AYD8_9BACT|nr:DivIVA domain-containing protein [Mycoplasmopsis gallopavonis]RIV16240.1 DivIVA domain-containing protein [Mycoplasmopsis gallopavonis]VEU72549.1 Uncharacterised protein [Mycoplasmopsis gallopavonis]
MKDILENIKSKIINATFNLNIEGYSREEVDAFLETTLSLINLVAQDGELLQQEVEKKNLIIQDQKQTIDTLKYEETRLKIQIQKLERELKESNVK